MYNIHVSPVPEKVKRRLFIIAGTIALGLGLVGIFIPVLPTTPFLLLAAICYLKGSQRLYDALLGNRFIGNYIRNYLEGKGMPLKMKIWTITLLWITIICSAVFATDNLIVRVILAVVLIGVTVHIIVIRTMKDSTNS
jgi:uncharacterized membrane protein YbaN (DUF454 family)